MSITCATWDGATNPSPTAALFKAEARNGDIVNTGQWEFSLTGTGTGTGQQNWPTTGGTLNTGDMFFDLDVEAGSPSPHTGSLTINSDSLSRTKTGTFNSIKSLGFSVSIGSSGYLRAQWTALDVTFYDSNGDSIGADVSQLGCGLPGDERPMIGQGRLSLPGVQIFPGDNTRVRVVASGTFQLAGDSLPSYSTVLIRACVWVQ